MTKSELASRMDALERNTKEVSEALADIKATLNTLIEDFDRLISLIDDR